MTMILFLALLAWTYLLLFHARFWRADQRLRPSEPPASWPDVAVVIPARNEIETIGEVVRRHADCDYAGRLDIVVVDDGSDDGTGDAAREAGEGARHGVTVIDAPPLRPGWSGKLNAVQAGLDHLRASEANPGHILLTDADIAAGPDLVSRLVARSERAGLALVSVMARLDARGTWGSLLIPAFIFFFQKLYPFPAVNDPTDRRGAAAGGVVLVRRNALAMIGDMEAIRGALIDDCALGAAIKNGPPRRKIELVLADGAADAVSLRDNQAFASIRDMVARTAFTQLGYSWLKLAGTVVGMFVLYLAAPLAVVGSILSGEGAPLLGLLVWGLMAWAYIPTIRLYGKPVWHVIGLPAAAAVYEYFTLLSAWRHAKGEGGQWKGRTYPARGAEA